MCNVLNQDRGDTASADQSTHYNINVLLSQKVSSDATQYSVEEEKNGDSDVLFNDLIIATTLRTAAHYLTCNKSIESSNQSRSQPAHLYPLCAGPRLPL